MCGPTPQAASISRRFEGGTKPRRLLPSPSLLSPGCAPHISFYLAWSALVHAGYHTMDKEAHCLPGLSELPSTLHLRWYHHHRYLASLGYGLGPGGGRAEGPFCLKVGSKFTGCRPSRINLESQNTTFLLLFFLLRTETPKLDTPFESAESPCFGS